jgi:hypothetical protein
MQTYPLLKPSDSDTGFARAHATRITAETAQELVDTGLAVRLLKGGKYAFKQTRATSPQAMDIRGQSALMGAAVIDANANGETWAQAIVKTWKAPLLGRNFTWIPIPVA